MKIAAGFKGERLIVIPHSFTELMVDSPLSADLYLVSIGYVSKAIFHRVSFKARPDGYLLLYCTNGEGVIHTLEGSYNIAINQVVIVKLQSEVTIESDSANPWTIYWTTFCGAKADIYSTHITCPKSIPPETYSRIEERTELFESIYATLDTTLSIERLTYANALLNSFILSFIYVDIFRESKPQDESHQIESLINSATHYMSENIERRVTLKELADFVGYSESYFYRKFIEAFEIPPIEYFNRLKINKASIYLIKTNMSIVQIATKMGFSSADYFSRLFKKQVGITATEFRKSDFRL